MTRPRNETEALRLENASLREEVARLRGLPAPEAERVIDPSESDITPPGERSDLPANQTYRALRPGMGPDGKPIPPRAKSGAETEAQRQRVNARRDIDHAVMTAPSRVTGEPQPSSPMTTYGDSGFCWQGDKGRAW